MSEPIRVFLVDDQELVRAGFRMLIDSQPDLTVVGEAGDPGGEPVFEPCEGLVAAGVHHAVMDEQSPEVFGGVRAGETVEGFVGERQFAGADSFQQGPGPGAWAHVGVDAFGSLGCGEHFDEPVQA